MSKLLFFNEVTWEGWMEIWNNAEKEKSNFHFSHLLSRSFCRAHSFNKKKKKKNFLWY